MLNRISFVSALVVLTCAAARGGSPTTMSIPDDFPRFIVPGHDGEMKSLRSLYWLHYQPAGPLITLWDEWMPMVTLWPARGSGAELKGMRLRWAAALRSRGMSG